MFLWINLLHGDHSSFRLYKNPSLSGSSTGWAVAVGECGFVQEIDKSNGTLLWVTLGSRFNHLTTTTTQLKEKMFYDQWCLIISKMNTLSSRESIRVKQPNPDQTGNSLRVAGGQVESQLKLALMTIELPTSLDWKMQSFS